MWIPRLDYRHLQSRQDPGASQQDPGPSQQDPGASQQGNLNPAFIIAPLVIVFVISSGVLTYITLSILRKKNYSPKFIPGKYLKRKWDNWKPGTPYGQVPGGSTTDRNQNTSYNPVATRVPEMNSTGLRRDSSVRSVITLPAYSVTPKPTEQVIAREGERAGMDVVVEFPETAEEEEARRDAQMEALYQIRVRRRLEIAAREERRRERREARSRGDLARLEELRRESLRRRSEDATTPSAATLFAEHRSRSRQNRIASVSYADLGEVRHDGSRLRANSADSDQRPLLESASSMGADARPSLSSSRTNSHFRGDSGSSMMSASTGGSDTDTLNPVISRTSTVGTASEHDDGDVGASHIPPPPGYEEVRWGEAPPYESPTVERRPDLPQLPPIASVPAIHIDIATPSTSTSNTPAFSPLTEPEVPAGSPHESVSGQQEPQKTAPPAHESVSNQQ